MPKKEVKIEQRRLRTSYFTSSLSISLLLLMLGTVGLLLLNTNRLSNYVKENIHFKVILDENLRDVDILRIQKSLDARPYVKETKEINKQEAAIALQESLGEDFIETLGYNPLSPTIEVKFLASYANTDSIPIIENDLKEFEGIKEVFYQKNLIQAVNENVHKISLFILFFSAFLFLIALTLINNTIRLSVYSKRFIIRTMQLVGATSSYIRKPFLLRSALQGLLSSLISILLLTGLIYLIQDQMEGIVQLSDVKLLLILYAIVLFIGISLNWISTFFAVSKYLKIKQINYILKMDKKPETQNSGFALGKENYILLAIGFVIIIIGFILMAGGKSDDPNVFNGDEIFSFRRITLAPIIVLAGFIFEIYAIMKKPKE